MTPQQSSIRFFEALLKINKTSFPLFVGVTAVLIFLESLLPGSVFSSSRIHPTTLAAFLALSVVGKLVSWKMDAMRVADPREYFRMCGIRAGRWTEKKVVRFRYWLQASFIWKVVAARLDSAFASVVRGRLRLWWVHLKHVMELIVRLLPYRSPYAWYCVSLALVGGGLVTVQMRVLGLVSYVTAAMTTVLIVMFVALIEQERE